MTSCIEKAGNKVESSIGHCFSSIGLKVGRYPVRTIALGFIVAGLCVLGIVFGWSTENRADKLWVPQNTLAEQETDMYQEHYASTTRFNQVIVRNKSDGGNVVTKSMLMNVMSMHMEIETNVAMVDDVEYTLVDLCAPFGADCANNFTGMCACRVFSIFKLWNYDMDTLEADSNVLNTINSGYTREDLESNFGKPIFDSSGNLVSAEAFSISYFLTDRSAEAGSDEAGTEADPINEGWEEKVFMNVLTESVPSNYASVTVDYFAGRSFSDEFGGAITGDLLLVNISYVVIFLFLGATLGNIKPGPGSRWTMSLGALVTVGLSVAAGFGMSSAFGFFFGPVHSLLPFILLGIGVDDAFVIVNAFNRERKVPRSAETNADITIRTGKALARAGASITVTSLTDIVAFGISSSSSLPALASFCAYAAIGIFFLWFFASTFFTATLVLDERRQRDNRRECLCCLTRKKDLEEEEEGFKEGAISRYFRNYHAPAILSGIGKVVVIIVYAGLLAFGIWGALNLAVEDTQRSFIPSDSYLTNYLNTADEFFPSTGIDLYIVFEGSSSIYSNRDSLQSLDSRIKDKSTVAPFIAEPVGDKYRNVISGFYEYLSSDGYDGVTLGSDNWPQTEADFATELLAYAKKTSAYAQDVSFNDSNELEAFRVKLEYVRLTKKKGSKVIDDAEKQIEAMDATRAMVDSWDDISVDTFTYSEKFIAIEGFKIIRKELFLNVGLALAAVAVIVLLTVASPLTTLIITVNVSFCIIEILGFMHALGIAIDSVSVINVVLAVGLSIDYSAHVGHCFMVKGGDDKNKRATEALADIGAAVLSGALTTFLAVVVLLFSSSYVFVTLSIQFALTVVLGVTHGLILLPVLLALLGPKPFSSAEENNDGTKSVEESGFKEEPKEA